ncbi:hypothetical protein Tco_1240954 [Tanacetum coccineum]
MDGCTKGPQLEEGKNLNTKALGTRRTPPGGTSAPAGQAQGGLSPAFMKENIDVLRTMIKMGPSTEEVGGYSFDGSSRSRSRGRPRSAQKRQKSVSRGKGTSKSHRSVRSEARSRSKSKSVKSKPQLVRASRRKSSSDSGYDTVSDSDTIDELGFHQTSGVYEGNKDLKDHLSIFSAAAEQEEWPMPVPDM